MGCVSRQPNPSSLGHADTIGILLFSVFFLLKNSKSLKFFHLFYEIYLLASEIFIPISLEISIPSRSLPDFTLSFPVAQKSKMDWFIQNWLIVLLISQEINWYQYPQNRQKSVTQSGSLFCAKNS